MSDVSRNARQAIALPRRARERQRDDDIETGHCAEPSSGNKQEGPPVPPDRGDQRHAARRPSPLGKADNQILGVVDACEDANAAARIVLVSKDINMRIKARALGLPAEDYFNDKVLEDTDLLYTGIVQLPDDFWDSTARTWSRGRRKATPTTA